MEEMICKNATVRDIRDVFDDSDNEDDITIVRYEFDDYPPEVFHATEDDRGSL